MLFKFPRSIVEAEPNEVFSYIERNLVYYWVDYLIHSNMRNAVGLSDWIKEEVNNPLPEVKAFSDKITTISDPEKQVIEILKYVQSNIQYVGDQENWKMNEYWARAWETIGAKEGDCEDGAILIYIIARLKGVPANRLMLFTGDVKGGGHCWLGFRPTEYILNWVFLDWCYWFNPLSIDGRSKFSIEGQKIVEYNNDGSTTQSNYYDIWFGFNEEYSALNFDYVMKRFK